MKHKFCFECGGEFIGIEILGAYDGVLFWRCSKCKSTWGRFSGKNIIGKLDEKVIKDECQAFKEAK